MSEYLIQDTTLQGIANAIRSKTGETNSITVNNMASKINSIETKQDLSFITAGAEQILSGYVGADADGNPVNGTSSISKLTRIGASNFNFYETKITSNYYTYVFTVNFDSNDYDYMFFYAYFSNYSNSVEADKNGNYGIRIMVMIDNINNVNYGIGYNTASDTHGNTVGGPGSFTDISVSNGTITAFSSKWFWGYGYKPNVYYKSGFGVAFKK